MKTTINAKLVAIQPNIYTNYVFQNLELQEDNEGRYITVTKCPNWQFNKQLNVGDEGFLEYEFAQAGDQYFDVSSNTTKNYSYTANYFMNFIPIKKDNIKEYKF